MDQNVIYLERGVEYHIDEDTILLMRCPKCSRENYTLAVYDGICIWCGFNGRELLNIKNYDTISNNNRTE